MQLLIVVNNPKDWPLDIPDVSIVSARSYLTDAAYTNLKSVKVFNLCKSYRYQSLGYYVSLLAAARGHKPLPNVVTIQDLKSPTMVRFVSDELDELIQKSLKPIQSERFTLSIYFGRNVAKRYNHLSQELYRQFQSPLLRAWFVKTNKWTLQNISPISLNEIPEDHRPFLVDMARDYFSRRHATIIRKKSSRFDMAILYNPAEEFPPSDDKALQRFVKAAEHEGFSTEMIRREDYGRLAEFDALFIRETTNVNHHTYRFARRAAMEGLVVIDDPESILKCTNKVYLAELLSRHNVKTPKTVIVHKDNTPDLAKQLGFPVILKQPDSSFSQGVVKVDNESELERNLEELLNKSELVIAQEFVPTSFDWRVGIIDQQPLYVCKYHMARKHWQIYDRTVPGKTYAGKVDTMTVEEAPAKVVKTALKAANLIGNGFYGVDLKMIDDDCFVIEVNDNPSVESGFEDSVIKDQLYKKVMEVFIKRVEQKKERS